MTKYDHKKIEKKWQSKWRETKLYASDDKKDKKFYTLVELTYTSGDLHIGHWFAWSSPDAYARFKRMQGNNVLFPVGGFDAFGLPAENAAIKHGIHPKTWTYNNIETMRMQFEKMGPSFDWTKEVITSDPDYYKWTQWLFIQLFKKNLAYRGKVWSNWCPECKTVLANEHVENGCCWRHTSTPVEQKLVDQWLIKITDYADRLIWPKDPSVDWPKSLVEGQNKWIGRSEGVEIKFKIKGSNHEISVFTTAPDTVFGVTFMVVAPEYTEKFLHLAPEEKRLSVEKYIKLALNKLEQERKMGEKEKTGIETGVFAIHPFTNEEIPIFVADYVLASVGTGAVMGVPAHDARDHDFAKKHNLPIKPVIKPTKEVQDKANIGEDGFWDYSEIKTSFSEESVCVNSQLLDGLSSKEARSKIQEIVEERDLGKKSVQYHLRDWSVSRQRYWGAPVPIIYCNNCWETLSEKDKADLKEGTDYAVLDSKSYLIHPVPEKDLPVTLPENVDYTPTGKPPLATAPEWLKTTCPVCGGPAQREPETLDVYVDSSWYFFRYPTPNYDKGPFDKEIIAGWTPIKVYFGGPEHILGHTLYARFITKFFHDLGLVDYEEFALKRINHGVILGPDGYRMSKSRGNVVNPDEQIEKYGADSVRMYLCFLGPHDKGGTWKLEGIEGMYRFLGRVWRLINENRDLVLATEVDSQEVLSAMHKTVKKVTNDLEKFQFNTAIASIMEYANFLQDKAKSARKLTPHGIRCAEWDEALINLVKLLAPFAPHMTEEIWVDVLGKELSIHKSTWPEFDPKLIRALEIEVAVQVDGKLRGQVKVSPVEANNQSKVEEIAKQDPKVSKWLKESNIKRVIFVEGKIINFVTIVN